MNLGNEQHWLIPVGDLHMKQEVLGHGGMGIVVLALYHGATVPVTRPKEPFVGVPCAPGEVEVGLAFPAVQRERERERARLGLPSPAHGTAAPHIHLWRSFAHQSKSHVPWDWSAMWVVSFISSYT